MQMTADIINEQRKVFAKQNSTNTICVWQDSSSRKDVFIQAHI